MSIIITSYILEFDMYNVLSNMTEMSQVNWRTRTTFLVHDS